MKKMSRRVRLALAGTAVGLAAAGGAGVVAMSATTASASAAHKDASILSICITIRELNIGPDCLVI